MGQLKAEIGKVCSEMHLICGDADSSAAQWLDKVQINPFYCMCICTCIYTPLEYCTFDTGFFQCTILVQGHIYN